VVTPNPFRVWFPQADKSPILGIKERDLKSAGLVPSFAGSEIVSEPLSSAAITAMVEEPSLLEVFLCRFVSILEAGGVELSNASY
jgi:hypothetical protein